MLNNCRLVILVDLRKFAQNLSVAVASQGVGVILSVVTSLFVPKVLGVEEFGYWQLFIFYSTYVGLFHFGLNDGVYLIYGGVDRGGIDKRSISSQFWFGLGFQLIIALFIACAAVTGGFEEEREFILIATALFLLLNNACGYLGYVFQAMNETKLFSFSVMVDKLVFFLPLCVLLFSGSNDFHLYVYAYAFSKTCSLLFCLVNARDILSSGLCGLKDSARESFRSVRVGVKLMLAN